MKAAVGVLLVLLAMSVAAAGGYWLGFRHAWQRGLMAEAPVRGAIAVHQLRALAQNQTDNLRTGFESDIDNGLLWWAYLESCPLFGVINSLSGVEVSPGYEEYVRRIANYRKAHVSPFRDPAVVKGVLDSIKEHDPELAVEFEASGLEAEAQIDRMVEKYAQ